MHPSCCKCQTELTAADSWYGLHKACFQEWFAIPKPIEFQDLVARSQSQAPHETQAISFFNGAYRKYSARLDNTGFILKVQQHEYPELPVTEFVCNQIYKSLDLSIPEHYLIRFPEEKLCFVTKNFMSGLYASDLVHIYHFINNGMAYDCETLVNIIGEKTGRKTEQERFAYLTLADSLIGNHDRHGRNLGFIQSIKGMQLAPFYDNPSALGLEEHSILGADLQPRGSIFTKDSDKPRMKDYVNEWIRLGYGDTVERFRKNHSIETIKNIIENSFLSEKRKSALLRLIQKRSDELCEK